MNDSIDINTLTSALKHELNGLLTGVKTGLEVMGMDDYFEDPDVKEEFDDIMRSANKLHEHIQDINLIYTSVETITLNSKPLSNDGFKISLEKIQTFENFEFSAIDLQNTTEFNIDNQYLYRLLYYMIALMGMSKVELNNLSISTQSNADNEIHLTHSENYPQEFSELLESKQSDHAKISLTLHLITKLSECLNMKIENRENDIILKFS